MLNYLLIFAVNNLFWIKQLNKIKNNFQIEQKY